MPDAFSLLIIKPLSVGRGDAPEILEKILSSCPVSLRRFRSWVICDTSWWALSQHDHPSRLVYQDEKIHALRRAPSWICLFAHQITDSNPYPILLSLVPKLSKIYGYKSDHPSDTAVYLSTPERNNLEAKMLLPGVNEFAHE